MTERSAVTMPGTKNVVLIAHDSRKEDLLEWVQYNVPVLREHRLFATGTTGALVEGATGLPIHRFRSGPLGGDQQVGAKIAEGELDVLIFFWDPLEPQPHDPDVKALLRIAVLYNIPTACNRATAELAVLNAAYLRARLREAYHLPYETASLHEVVFDDKHQKADGVSTMDVAKRLIDHGFHPPTVYFPLVVQGALMIEPTETESKETLDAFAAAMLAIAEEARRDPAALHAAPERPVRARLDETRAARKPVLRWKP